MPAAPGSAAPPAAIEVVDLAKSFGTVRAVDPKLTVFFFMGSINWMTRWFTTEGPLTGEQVARQLVDLVEGALRSR